MDNFNFEYLRQLYKGKQNKILKITLKKLVKYISLNIDSFPFHYHPLGFIYCKLHTFSNGETIRLHIWDFERNSQKPVMDCHDHFYTVNSFVLCGEIHNILYQDQPSELKNQVLYEGAYNSNGDRYLIKTNQTVNFAKQKLEIINSGSIYSIPKKQFHSSFVPENTFTCTLVYTEFPEPDSKPLVVGLIEGKDEYYFEHIEISNELKIRLIKNLNMQMLMK